MKRENVEMVTNDEEYEFGRFPARPQRSDKKEELTALLIKASWYEGMLRPVTEYSYK